MRRCGQGGKLREKVSQPKGTDRPTNKMVDTQAQKIALSAS
ncbi:hypothetical protein RISK_005281 [Rhodopirellula islandica]|uniref:Uncharacterized protein n=1 Tax=Rhodopirellula islandica TaxID=595434 RepID=A0A0J1B5X5_RHOIS|nr:hypothetical protein RISK_005281 [Rhodopirellula islandica]